MPPVNPLHKNSQIIHISDTNNPRILVIGIGNIYRSDDAVGLYVVQHLKKQAPRNVIILEGNGDGAALIEYWKNFYAVILIDAVSSGAKPGTLHRFDVHTRPIPKFINLSTHSFSIVEAIELARILKQLPHYFIIYGIEGKHFTDGTELSPEVKDAIQEVVTHILQDIHFLVNSYH
jgi:hydrogenase maturation protease